MVTVICRQNILRTITIKKGPDIDDQYIGFLKFEI